MAETLIDWLFTDDVSGNFIRGTLILFPRMIDRWNIASLIVSKWEEYKVVIVTDYPNEFTETINDILDTKWTDLELISFPLISYNDIDNINRALKNTEIDVIIFDDARMLATISSVLNTIEIQPKIIVLTSWGDTMQQLDTVVNKFNNMKLLTLDFISDISNINYQVTKVLMSNRQLNYYDQIRSREIQMESDQVIPYSISRMITLYSYPDSIMEDALLHKSTCLLTGFRGQDNIDQSSNLDKLGPTSWLNSSYIDTISDDGPKLLSVLDGIISNWPLKQLVITRFNHRFGVDLITSFLHLMGENRKNPYESNEIFHTSCTDEYEITLDTFHKFNSSEIGVLISNIIPIIPLKGISVIHIADSYSFLNLRTILDRVYKRYLNKTGSDLVIYSHLAIHPNEKSTDEILYGDIQNHIKEADYIYTGLISQGKNIVFHPKDGLVVT
jgi:hypothetical protein